MQIRQITIQNYSISGLELTNFIHCGHHGMRRSKRIFLNCNVDIQCMTIAGKMLPDIIRKSPHNDDNVLDAGQLAGIKLPIQNGTICDFMFRAVEICLTTGQPYSSFKERPKTPVRDFEIEIGRAHV